MKKAAFFLGLLIIIGTCSSFFAIAAPQGAYGRDSAGAGYCYGLMRDENGGFISQDAYGERLDQAIVDGYILEEDRDYYFDMYDYCIEYGCGYPGGGRGLGRGRGCCRA